MSGGGKAAADASEIARELYDLGMHLLRQGQMQAASFQFRKALAVGAEFPDAALALGYCLHELGHFADALALYDQLIQKVPGYGPAWNNRGRTLLETGRFLEAAESFSRALDLMPALHDARVALASCLQALGQIDAAMAACDKVLAVDPEHAEAHWNRSLLLLLQGEYEQGWQEYEWRWSKRGFSSPRRSFAQPRWQGQPLAGKTILIHAEQGFGDTLQFCRYVPLLVKAAGRVVFECQPSLVPLMRTLDQRIEVVAMGEPLPTFDLHAPLMSLPLIFRTTLASIPATTPYIMPSQALLAHWQQIMPCGDKLRVGLCWAGKRYPDPLRSCPGELLQPLGQCADVAWYSLQMEPRGPLPFAMQDLTSHIRHFGDTAALVTQLDLIITIDTAVAHLAGGLGKAAWVMLPFAADWRWLLERGDSPWYPGMRLFRQASAGDWPGVIQAVKAALQHLVAAKNQEKALLTDK